MGKRKHKNKEYNNDEKLNNQNSRDSINNNGALNPLELINYLGNNSNSLNSKELLKMLISGRLTNSMDSNKSKNQLMNLISNINVDGINMSDINKLSESLNNTNNAQDLLNKIISNKLNLDNNVVNDNAKKRKKSKDRDLDNLEFLKSLRSIVDPSKVEFIDKIIVMYENGEI